MTLTTLVKDTAILAMFMTTIYVGALIGHGYGL